MACEKAFEHLRKFAEIFPGIFCFRYSVVETQPSIEFQNPIFSLLHFNNSYFIVIVDDLFLMNYPIVKHFKRGYISRVFTLEVRFLAN